MKWPDSLTCIRHGQSEYNVLKALKDADPRYQLFKKAYAKNHRSAESVLLAKEMHEKYRLKTSDFDTKLTPVGISQGFITGTNLRKSRRIPKPDIIIWSPYERTEETKNQLCYGWPELASVFSVSDDRVREQEHGLSLLYSDWRIFHVFHPDQKDLHELLGPYWYQYPQGESVSQTRDRLRDFQSMLIRECTGMHVMVVMHHLTKLAIRANLERLSPKQFIYLDNHEKPVNCGVTHYVGNPDVGKDGRLELDFYNLKLYED